LLSRLHSRNRLHILRSTEAGNGSWMVREYASRFRLLRSSVKPSRTRKPSTLLAHQSNNLMTTIFPTPRRLWGSVSLGSLLCSVILRLISGSQLPVCFMMRRAKRLRDYPQLPWVDQKICLHPVPTLLLKFNDDDETVYRCDVCGKLLTSVELVSEAAR
jgi:hypothetical protein